MEAIQIKYLRWTLGLDSCTPKYIVLRETDRAKFKVTSLERLMKFIDRAKLSERKLVKEAVAQDERMGENGKLVMIFREVSESTESASRLREEGKLIGEILRRARQIQDQSDYNRIQGAKYNKRYKDICPIGRPAYLRNIDSKGSHKIIARLRCGNEEKINRYWLGEESKKCKICEKERETLEHLLEYSKAKDSEGRRLGVKRVLDEGGSESVVKWMRELKREEKEKERERE